MKRAIIIVLDSVGIGQMPDAAKYGDEGSNTLVHVKKANPWLTLKNLLSLGLGNIEGEEINLLGQVSSPIGCYGKMAEASIGKDTTTGHWEMAGVITKKPFPTFTKTGFPKEVIDAFEKAIGTKTLGNYAQSGTVIIQELGDEHVKTGYPIVYTSADSVFQIAAHEEIVPVEKLYAYCQAARKILTGPYGVARVIARPFIGSNGNYTRTKNRRDFSLPPTGPTILDLVKEAGMKVAAVGKIEDIFEHRGISEAVHTANNAEGIDQTIAFMKQDFSGLLFTNLVDYDMIYGHRNDAAGYAKALQYFDDRLPEIMAQLKEEDILFITADHGCDPTTPSTDHSREYVPILVYGQPIKANIPLGIRKTFADLGASIADYLEIPNQFEAESFYQLIKKDI